MIKKIRSHHDAYFQAMMEKVEVASSFFQAYIGKELGEAMDWNTLAIADAVRRAPGRKPLYTDITYQASTKDPKGSVFLHVEQERGIDKRMLERIWQYNVGLYAKYRNQGYHKLPLIINFVIYNGNKEDYPYFKDICDYFERPDLAKLMIGNPFQLVNLNKQEDENLVLHGPGGVMEILLKRASQAKFSHWLQAHKDLMRRLPAKTYLNISLDYALEVGKDNPEDIVRSFILIYPELKDTIMTAAQQLRKEGMQQGMQQGIQQGMQQGVQQGIEQGKKQAKLNIAQNMLSKGLELSFIQEVTGLSLEEIKDLAER